MTDKLKAQVSAFLDDELLAEESELLVRRLCNDDELRQTALRYTLIGDALRGSLQQIDAGLVGSIRRVIDEEPDVQVSQRVASAGGRARTPVWRALGGGAIAATVAALALVSVQQLRAPAPDTAAVAGTGPAEAPIVVPLDNSAPNDPFTRGAPAPVRQAGTQSQFNPYWIQHNQFTATPGRRGVFSYLTLGVGEDPDAPLDTPAVDGAGGTDATPTPVVTGGQ